MMLAFYSGFLKKAPHRSMAGGLYRFQRCFALLLCLGWGVAAESIAAAPQAATFFRGINLNGPAVEIDGQYWLAGDSPSVRVSGGAFENQSVALEPPTDASRATMIRSSRWGGTLDVEIKEMPRGWYQIFVFVWEDNHTSDFQLQVDDRQVIERFSSGKQGQWHRLGPFLTEVKDESIKVSARGGDANLSGIEIWSGRGRLPMIVPSGFVQEPTPDQLAFFENTIRPLLVDRCYECHSADSDELGGELLLDSRKGMIAGGASGVSVVAGDPEQSMLMRAIRYTDSHLRMPPDGKLPQDEIEALASWISMGLPDPRLEDTIETYRERTAIDWEAARDFWSLRPIVKPPLPVVKLRDWPKTAIDHFVLADIEAEGLVPTLDADKIHLIRRVTFDLIGLPPSPREVDDFMADTSSQAFEKVVDRLLESKHYGERWGRHWLDIVRYSDTAGDNSDFPIPQMVKYRDWVINAFNRDLPYDEFVRQQLAGDLLPYDSPEDRQQKLIATGYIANARRFGSRVDDYPQHLTIEDTLDNLGRAFLASTINCARCHDHKFDPFTAEDYYALYGIFHSTQYPWPGIELDQKQRDLVPLADTTAVQDWFDKKNAEQRRLEERIKRLEAERDKHATDSAERKVAEQQWQDAKEAAKNHANLQPPFDHAYAVQEGKVIEDATLHIKGNPSKLGDRVPRRFLSVLGGEPLRDDDVTSGRLQLAEWIVSPKNPLAMRAIVNRVWLYHFGRGLVQTPNDFGRQGTPPTHPELLDWLASEFRESGYSIKTLHRTILRSRVYQLSSRSSSVALDRDPNNVRLSYFPRRRLDAEAIRDTLLFLGGTLDLSPAGPHPFPPPKDWNFTQHNPFKAVYDSNHRSVYLMTQRIQRHPFLAIFDGADPAASTPIRLTSTTPVQSLYLLNDPLVHSQAERFAERVLAAVPEDQARVSLAFRLALGRTPDEKELRASLKFLSLSRNDVSDPTSAERVSWQALARVIFRLNEFVYVD